MIKYIMALALLLSGCSTNKSVSEDAFNVMCSNYELVICGDIEAGKYNNANTDEIRSYSQGLFQTTYIYKSDIDDNKDYYDFMTGNPMYGDCDDYVITLLENLLRDGMIDKGQAGWIFGSKDGELHHWLIINDVIYDTFNMYGIETSNAYGYVKQFIVYSY